MSILTNLTRRQLILLAAFGSAALFFGALAFQFIGGVEPCAMCFWQRWPHRIAIGLGILGVILPFALVAAAGALTMLVSVGLAAFHSGVERDWWDGPASCTSRGVDLLNSECGPLDFECGSAIVLCDEISWQLFGLSMANYNVFISAALLVLWIVAARRA